MNPSPLVRLDEDEFDVRFPDGKHRAPATVDPVRTVHQAGSGFADVVTAGFELLRAGAGIGLRLVLRRSFPLALNVGPLGRQSQTLDRPVGPSVAVRMDGEDVDLDEASVDLAFPHATGQLVVFVPQAGATETVWRRQPTLLGPSYGSRLATLLDWTPVYLRADAVPVRDAGVELGFVLQRLVDAWPTEVRQIALVGQGSGGLVIRAACGMLSDAEEPWTDRVTDVVALGTPHLVAAAPRYAPQVVGRQIEERLVGITSDQPDVPPLEHARYTLVTERGAASANAVGGMFGSLLWWRQTATGRKRKAHELFPTADRFEVSTRESPMVNHPEIHRLLLAALAPSFR